jgi:RHS repeat-associated protein
MLLTFTNTLNRMDGYSYDAAGNLLNDGNHAYTYDAENRIIQVDQGQTAVYAYDGDGQRIEKTVAGAVLAQYLHDLSGNTITELNASGVWDRSEIYAGAHHLATYGGGASGTTYFVQQDWLGTERARVLPNGDLSETCISLPFGDGQTCTGSADPSPNHFTGKERDSESGLDNFGARYNASSMGRFMTPDPGNLSAIFHMNDPQSWNGYAYARNNPLKYTDPSGLDYTICDSDGKNCSHMDDKTFDSERNKDKGELFQNGSMFHFDNDGNKVMDGTYQWNGPDIPGDPAANLAAMGMIGNGGTAFVGAFAKNMAITAAGGAILAPMAELSAAIAQTARLSMLKPLVTNPELEEIVNELFQVTDKLPGGTAGAVRYESMTGDLLAPAGHAQEAGDIVRQLDTFLKNNAGISTNDQAVAKELIRDLQNALSGH